MAASIGGRVPLGPLLAVRSGDDEPEPARGGTGERIPSRTPPFRVPRLETILLVALVALGVAIWTYRSRALPGVPESVAVLPFQTVQGEPEQEFFAYGMSDEIRNALSRLPGLQVASRTSSARFVAEDAEVRQVAGELGVHAVLEGTVQRSEGRVRVTVRLVDARTDRLLWARSYDRELSVENLFAVQAEIAAAVAGALEVELDGVEDPGVRPSSLESHELYLLGLYHWNRRTVDDLRRAREFYQAAVDRDPGYAPAHAGLAKTFVLLPLYARTPADSAMPAARTAAARALELDPRLAEAHAALGLVATTYDWDWEEAEEQFQTALQLEPRYATAREWYGAMLDAQGRFDEARVQHDRAVALDPFSAIIGTVRAHHLLLTGDIEAAVAQFEATLELQPDLALTLQWMADAFILSGRFDEAADALQRRALVLGSDPAPWTRVVAGMSDPSRRDGALDALAGLGASGDATRVTRAKYLAVLGADDLALDVLQDAVGRREFLTFYSAVDPFLAGIGDADRMASVLEPLGLDR